MRKFVHFVFPGALVGIGLAVFLSCVSCLNSPALDGPRDEAVWALALFWSRIIACGFALCVLIAMRRPQRRRGTERPESSVRR
jgi:hypothetical protein